MGNQSALPVRENEMKSEGTRTTSLYTSLGEKGVSVLPLHEKQPLHRLPKSTPKKRISMVIGVFDQYLPGGSRIPLSSGSNIYTGTR
jgi:hypothetical protein